jgi:hypothetical protein
MMCGPKEWMVYFAIFCTLANVAVTITLFREFFASWRTISQQMRYQLSELNVKVNSMNVERK